MAFFKVIENKATDQWRWQLREDNNEIIAIGETHPSKANVERAIDALAASVAEAAQSLVIYETDPGTPEVHP